MFEAVEELGSAGYSEKQPKRHSAGSGASASRHDLDVNEQGTTLREKHDGSGPLHNPSLDLKRTASNVLSKVASRITARSIVSPPPPPDGGVKAWTQVAMCWLVVLITWGWVNSCTSIKSLWRDLAAYTMNRWRIPVVLLNRA